jgi:hypothetical protein
MKRTNVVERVRRIRRDGKCDDAARNIVARDTIVVGRSIEVAGNLKRMVHSGVDAKSIVRTVRTPERFALKPKAGSADTLTASA